MKKQLLSLCVLVVFGGVGAESFGEAANSRNDVVGTVSKQDKKVTAKKKVAMCSECGKSESECTCDHDKKEHKNHQHGEPIEKKSSEHDHSH
ncbi:hypothetical protein [Bdellovibrio bacteriovorus]|uniref:hypothetical protein n=1 Tax=Bdellovibrio bacteriovorus TaxID=959 RepID=UPI0035A71F36